LRARKIARNRKRLGQADVLENVCQRDLPQDVEKQLFAIAKALPRVISETANLTSRESEILCLETLRRSEVDDLSAPVFDQVAQAAGTSGPKLRAHVEDHEAHGHLSASDRKAWSRAHDKVAKALTRAALTSLLAIAFALSFALSLALLNAINQGRSLHQNAFVNQASSIDGVTLAHQSKMIDEIALGHQSNSIDGVVLAHQSKMIDEIALGHQSESI
jgi:hypothetical protein